MIGAIIIHAMLHRCLRDAEAGHVIHHNPAAGAVLPKATPRFRQILADGKRHARNIYAKTRAECEEKLDALIREMQAERKLLLDQVRGIIPPKKLAQKQRQIWEYMKFHPRETNLSSIARGAAVNWHTVAKHYEMIRGMVGSG